MKKIKLIPYDKNGNMMNYCFGQPPAVPGLVFRETRVNYRGEPIPLGPYDDVEWQEAQTLDLSIFLIDMEKGRSRLSSWWQNEDGSRWPMFFSDFVDLAQAGHMKKGIISGKFEQTKRGTAYGLKTVKIE